MLSENDIKELSKALGHKPSGRPRKNTQKNKLTCINGHINRGSVSEKEVVG